MQFDRRIGAAVDEVADRIGFQRRLAEVPDFARAIGQRGMFDRLGVALQVRVEQAELALLAGAGP